ncbi:MAG: hypothetical protein MK035_03010 [Dehalococcoidia bacterium]|nr:hypothetical protein [Dehalococcoidia bacterium]
MKALLIIPACLLLLSCSSTDNSGMGFWIDHKPLRGTIEANRENVRPYRQCVDEETFKNINCK